MLREDSKVDPNVGVSAAPFWLTHISHVAVTTVDVRVHWMTRSIPKGDNHKINI